VTVVAYNLDQPLFALGLSPSSYTPENSMMLHRFVLFACCGMGVAALPVVMTGCSPSEPAKDAPAAVEVEEVVVPVEGAEPAEKTVADESKEAVDAAKEEADQLIDDAKETVEAAVDAAGEKAEELQEKAAGAVSEAADTVADAADAAASATSEAVEKVKDAVTGEEPAAAEPAPGDGATSEPDTAALAAVQLAVLDGAAMNAETVQLGDASLTSGVPGAGPITLEQIDAWLSDPQNHVQLIPELPLGLATGANQITGIDVNPLTRAKIELGRQLYFDTRLSKDSTISCASCHNPVEGYTAHTQFGVGIDGQEGGRNSPVAYNRILSGAQFWDGRVDSLEAQAVGPIANPIEMGFTHEGVVERLSQIPVYKRQFDAIFGEVTIDRVGQAIATFERAIVTGPSPWDYYEALLPFEALDEEDIADDEELAEKYAMLTAGAEANPMSDSAKRGRDIFFTEKGNCTACHVGANLADEKYHNLGVGMEKDDPDLGRFAVTGNEQDMGAFKTPTVRNVALTAPYMHDGSQQTLEEVVEWYNKGGHPNPHLSEKVRPLNLTDQEKADLVEFMKACTGPTPTVETSRLPAEG
jgi:cytochrome c peroxidase